MNLSYFKFFFSFLILYTTLFALETNPPLPLYNTTVSDTHAFIWFRVAKVATRSITDIFVKQEVPNRYENLTPYDSKKFKNYFKFAFVRNPWSRLVSCYFNKVVTKNHRAFRDCYDKDFDYFVDFVSHKNLETADRHIQLQCCLIPLHEVDFIGRIENFDEDIRYVLEKIGVDPTIEIPQKNKSNHLPYTYYYNERTRECVAKMYKRDIFYFGYTFEN